MAKGKLNTPVVGVALGVPLSRVSAGPFYQFMNMDDSEGDLSKLVDQLARRVQNCELDSDVVKSQVATFKATEEFGFGSQESHMFMMEFPRMLEHMLMRTLDLKKVHSPAR